MGNQNKTQQNVESVLQSGESLIINLDEIIEQWIRSMWSKAKSKSLSQYKYEDLLIKINWKHVSFVQKDIQYYNSSLSHIPQTIFRTHFDNKTVVEQTYMLTTNQSTHSTFKFVFTQRLYKSHESNIHFNLPEQTDQMNNSSQVELDIPFGQDTTKQYEKFWHVNSQIRVPGHTRILAELIIDEEEFQSHFSVSIQFSGRITALISTRQSPNIYLKSFNGDVAHIIEQAMKTNPLLSVLQVIDGDSPSVAFTIYGKCLYRYGVKQHIVLNQELLQVSAISYHQVPSAPVELCHSVSSDVKTDDLIRSDAT